MQLEAFRVQNFKKVQDSGWVPCRNLTVFVGKNEAGKSALFRGLSKLNPSDGERYDALKEFPRRRYTREFTSQDWPVATGRFALNDEERQTLAQICPLLKNVQQVEVTRHYSWTLTITFDPAPQLAPISGADLRTTLERIGQHIHQLNAPPTRDNALIVIKQAALDALTRVIEQISAEGVATRAQVNQALDAIINPLDEAWQKPLFEPMVNILQQLAERTGARTQVDAAESWVRQHLPTLVYFDHYDVIDGAVHMPSFIQQIVDGLAGPRLRTTHCLFKHAGVEVAKLANLGPHQPDSQINNALVRRQADERAILVSLAANAMTRQFAEWWDQRTHTFRYQLDGDYFRIWVSDDLDPSEIELDQRSAGMQYFFSFFTVFLAEAHDAHANSILLLDEPGLHLHATAQTKVVQFLANLAKNNQLLYSTHSPFLIDLDHLEYARAVYEGEDGTTKVSADAWPRDREALFPLQAALSYQVAQGLLIAKRQIIIENLTDLWLLKALEQALAARGRGQLRPDLVLVPAAGLARIFPLASMLMGHDVEVAVLLSGQEPARHEGAQLVEKLLAGEDRRCLFLGDFTNKPHAELEDIFPENDYILAVKKAYPGIDVSFDAQEKALPCVVQKVEAVFARKGLGVFERWKPAMVLRDRLLEAPRQVSLSIVDVMSKVFETLNGLFSPPEKT